MKCPKCQFENREGAKFCGKCRSKLSLICPHCDAENPPENAFCDQCGSDLKEPEEVAKTEPKADPAMVEWAGKNTWYKDDETLRETLAYNLQSEGYLVAVAGDGRSGLDLARRSSMKMSQ